MAIGRVYQAAVTIALGILPPSGRVYQASARVVDLPDPPSGRIYIVSAVTAAGGIGTGRIYMVSATTSGDPSAPPSGLRTFRGGNTAAVTTRTFRSGQL